MSWPLNRISPLGDFIAFPAGQHIAERGLAGAVRAHDGMYFAGLEAQGEAFQDFFAVHAGVQIFDF